MRRTVLWRLSFLAVLAAVPAGAAKAPWHEGLPPLRMAARLGIAHARFAELDPWPGLAGTVYVVAGEKEEAPFAAMLIDAPDGPTFHRLPSGFADGSERRVETKLLYSRAPAFEVVLELGGVSGPSLWYEWAESVPVGSISLGEALPRLRAKRVAGGSWDSAEARGRVAVLNSWSTWCIPCVEEIPGLNGLVEEFREDPRVAFFAVSPESRGRVRKFVTERPFTYTQLVSSDGPRVFGLIYPRHVVLDAESNVVFDSLGWSPDIVDRLRDAVRAALREAGEAERRGGAGGDAP